MARRKCIRLRELIRNSLNPVFNQAFCTKAVDEATTAAFDDEVAKWKKVDGIVAKAIKEQPVSEAITGRECTSEDREVY
jgi:hypothetical protein